MTSDGVIEKRVLVDVKELITSELKPIIKKVNEHIGVTEIYLKCEFQDTLINAINKKLRLNK